MTERIRAEQKEMILFKVYSQLLGRMSKENFISFSDFMAMTEMDNRPEKEILAELKNMEKEMEGTNGAVQTVRQHSDQE
jgi:hypothetical protein